MRDRVFFRMHVHNLQIFVSCLKIFLKQRSTTQGIHERVCIFQKGFIVSTV